jgi:leucyl-tRNA synthetase
VYSEAVESLLLCLSTFAPHLADELLDRLGFEESSYTLLWPLADEEVAREEKSRWPVQVNGKLRSRIVVAADSDEVTLQQLALQDPDVSKVS